jgi:hypothetical protein
MARTGCGVSEWCRHSAAKLQARHDELVCRGDIVLGDCPVVRVLDHTKNAAGRVQYHARLALIGIVHAAVDQRRVVPDLHGPAEHEPVAPQGERVAPVMGQVDCGARGQGRAGAPAAAVGQPERERAVVRGEVDVSLVSHQNTILVTHSPLLLMLNRAKRERDEEVV